MNDARGEVALQQRIQGVQPAEITVRLSSQTKLITNGWQALSGGRAYDIQAVAPDERGAFLSLLAEAKAP
jgi:head-tail adaptor